MWELSLREMTCSRSGNSLSKSLDSEKSLTFPGDNYCGGGHGWDDGGGRALLPSLAVLSLNVLLSLGAGAIFTQ